MNEDSAGLRKTEMELTLDGIRDIKVYQNKNGYRFSIDALLLYSFVNVRHAEYIVDLGTGSGVIGLMLAKKYPEAAVTLVELQESLYRLTVRNIRLNELDERVQTVLADIREIKKHFGHMSSDLVVSNPPFRTPVSGRISEEEEKAVARHEMRLTFKELAEAATYLLKAKGRFFMIFHPERLLEVIDTLRENRLEPKRIRFVHNDAGSVSKIVLIEAVKEGRAGVKIEKPLFIYDSEGSYSHEVKLMYGPRKG